MEAHHEAASEESPYGIQSKKLAMWLFILADSATFGAVLYAYGFLRVGSGEWSTPFAFSPTIANAMAMTFVFLTSSLTMVAAVLAAQAGRKSSAVRWLGATMLLGIVFTVLHFGEWFRMFHEGWGLFHNPLGGAVQFGAGFFSVTGLSLLHVVAGVVALAVIAIGFSRGRFDAAHVETTGLYWQFVSIVWMFIFPLVYLMNAH
jgi:heme/copper-type cytochrome/quinol oxidase subunit 3